MTPFTRFTPIVSLSSPYFLHGGRAVSEMNYGAYGASELAQSKAWSQRCWSFPYPRARLPQVA